jgi:adenylate cyclase
MPEQRIARRLAAILAADVAGYSRMMEAGEASTIAAMRQIWSEKFNPAVAAHHGRIVKTMGDGALVEFGSVVDAVECAVEIQRAMGTRNLAAEWPVEFRIGVNIGEIVIDGDDILGDGVNIAARLEGQAPSGGILASDVVHAQVAGKIGVTFLDAGEFKLKNIDRPVRAWRWHADKAAPTTKSVANFGSPLAADKPSIAVLPFSVMSNDPEQEFFADGLVEDILTTISKLSGLSVIARNSSFVYKGRAVDVRQVARELGVRFVLEGSVRKSGNRMRITAQLIDATTGVHIWADRFDRSIEDIFAVQDEITLTLATEMQVRLTEGEQARLRYTTTTNVEAWSLFIQGMNHERGAPTGTADAHAPGRRCWEKALALDPGSAVLNAMLGVWHFTDARHGWTGDRESALEKAEAYVDRALAIDPHNPDAFRAISGVLLMKSRFDEAADAARKSFKFGPNLADTLAFGGFVLACCGKASEGIGQIEKAIALSPNHPAWYLGALGNSYRLAGRSEEASNALRAYHTRLPGYGLGDIVMIQEQAGHLEEARETAAELALARPTFTIASWLRTQFRSDINQMAADLSSLRAAGVPEQ